MLIGETYCLAQICRPTLIAHDRASAKAACDCKFISKILKTQIFMPKIATKISNNIKIWLLCENWFALLLPSNIMQKI